MTVPYQGTLPPRFSSLGWLARVLFKWRGGVYVLLIWDLLVWIVAWYIVWYLVTVRPRTDQAEADYIEDCIKYVRAYQNEIRTMMTFMLVYYYQQIYARSKDIFFAIPFPDSCFLVTAASVGKDSAWDEGIAFRRRIFRYVLTSTFCTYHACSSKFAVCYKKPYKTLVRLGLLTTAEAATLLKANGAYPYFGECAFLPLAWATQTLRNAAEQGHVGPDRVLIRDALESIRAYKAYCADLLFQVYLPFPLLISQLVTYTVYTYFLVSIIASQNMESELRTDFPFFTVIQMVVVRFCLLERRGRGEGGTPRGNGGERGRSSYFQNLEEALASYSYVVWILSRSFLNR